MAEAENAKNAPRYRHGDISMSMKLLTVSSIVSPILVLSFSRARDNRMMWKKEREKEKSRSRDVMLLKQRPAGMTSRLAEFFDTLREGNALFRWNSLCNVSIGIVHDSRASRPRRCPNILDRDCIGSQHIAHRVVSTRSTTSSRVRSVL